jgi:Flp pilus assembly protein protease CpaA
VVRLDALAQGRLVDPVGLEDEVEVLRRDRRRLEDERLDGVAARGVEVLRLETLGGRDRGIDQAVRQREACQVGVLAQRQRRGPSGLAQLVAVLPDVDVLEALGVGLLLFLPFYALGGMGAGDVKLMAAVGTFLGPMNALLAAVFSLIAGGVLAMIVILLRRGALETLRRYGSILKFLCVTGKFSYIPPAPGEAAATRFPYSFAIATGTVAALWWLSYLSPLTALFT